MNQRSIGTPSVAVCLAAFNGKRWLPEQLTSILMQTGVVLKIFISVDCSKDGTEDWVDFAAKNDLRIVVLQHGARFGGASRNFFRIIRSVEFSEFDYVSFADQDDIWLPDKLLRAHQLMLKTGTDAYSSNVMAFWAGGKQLLIEKSQKQVRWDFLFEAAGPGCTYVIRKDLACAIQEVIRSRSDVHEVGLHDWFVYAFARANGYRWVIDDYAGMLYRQHDKNQVGVNSGAGAFLHRARKVLSGWGMTQSALIAQLVGLGEDPFVKRWSGSNRSGLLWLALHGWQCRRRVRDKIIFALSCVALCIAGKRSQ